ncbi:MAG: ribosomal protein S18-alanine N-acetyltransferase [Acidobacteriaceae bacterium]|jgi:ribosomal-protein-alanine N-acetyltransferase|nr:ribosomal protein S18-alanine N-acetyltransferase [Acidobacteriaceae bacterium]
MTVSIRALVTADEIQEVIAVDRECFTNPWTEEMYRAELAHPERSRFLLASVDGHVVGACSYWRIVDERHINNLAVRPSFRRAGIGAALLDRVLSTARDERASAVLLEVRRSNDAARRLYERAGFAVIDVRRAYYTNPVEDALVLTLTLTSSGT